MAPVAGGKIEIHLDNKEGELLGIMEVKNVVGNPKWATQSCKIKSVQGVHDVYFIFKGNGKELFNFDWWRVYSE